MTLAHTFTRTLVEARRLDVAALRTTIRATLDDGLRAASYDGPTARSASVSSHPERMALHDRRDRTADDLGLVDHHAARFVGAVYELATRSHSGPFPNDWRTAVIGARRLVAMDAIGVLETSGQRPARFVHQAGDAVHDLVLIAGRHMARPASKDEQLMTGETCLAHARIAEVRDRYGALRICQGCYDIMRRAGLEPTRDHKDPDLWPPSELLHAHDEMTRTGKRIPYHQARTAWVETLGVRQRTA